MTPEEYQDLMQALFILNTGVQQLIDINMLALPENQREVVDIVHNKLHKSLSDDSWVEDYKKEFGQIPDL